MPPTNHPLQKPDPLAIDCPVRAALDVLRGRWKPLLLYQLKDGPKRFSHLQAALPGASAQALTVQLRQLEHDGVLTREVHADVPPRVEYTLTDLGESLSGVMDALTAWGLAYLDRKEPPLPPASGHRPRRTHKSVT